MLTTGGLHFLRFIIIRNKTRIISSCPNNLDTMISSVLLGKSSKQIYQSQKYVYKAFIFIIEQVTRHFSINIMELELEQHGKQ